jgi:hypothetical protein
MKRNFEKFQVKLGEEVFECDPENELRMDETTINDDLKDQPSWFAWYATLSEKADSQYQEAKFFLEVIEAEIDAEIRSGEGKKPTEAQIKAQIILDERYQKVKMEMIEAKKIVGILKAVTEAFRHRKETLIALASNMRVQSDPEIFIKKQEYKD